MTSLNNVVSNKDSSNKNIKKIVTKVNVYLTGACTVGKTVMVNRYIDNKYDPGLPPTLGTLICGKNYSVKRINSINEFELQIFDNAETFSEKFIDSSRFKNTNVVAFCFDLENLDRAFFTLTSVQRIYKRAKKYGIKNKTCILVGCKYDKYQKLSKNIQGDILKKARKYCRKMKSSLVYTSSKDNTNIEALFKLSACLVNDDIKLAKNIEIISDKAATIKVKRSCYDEKVFNNLRFEDFEEIGKPYKYVKGDMEDEDSDNDNWD